MKLISSADCNALLADLGDAIRASSLEDWQKLCVIWAWVVAVGDKLSDEQQDACAELAGLIAASMGPDERVLN